MKPIEQPLTIFLIGTTGDLAKKKILKAIYKLYQDGLLPEIFFLVGNARSQMTTQEYREFVRNIVRPTNASKWEAFSSKMRYVSGSVTSASTFAELQALSKTVLSCGNHLWYIATLPSLYTDIIKNMRASGLDTSPCGWTKVLLEKPFGTDLASSRQLNEEIGQVFAEDQIYRIDHFLAKETIQNILVFRFANGIFEHLWNKNFIEYIEVHATESLGIEGREEFYDATGAVRDVVQNHVLNMLAVALMEEPQSLEPDTIRQARQLLLSQLQPVSPHTIAQHVAFGQYTAGPNNLKGYRENPHIPPTSTTETAVALKCFVSNPRWQGVPMYLRAGKQLAKTMTQITFHFKEPLNTMFGATKRPQLANTLTFCIQPNEGVVVTFQVKKPGINLALEAVPMRFHYDSEFQMGLVEAYVKLIYDAVHDDPTLFSHADGIEYAWRFIQPILDYMQRPGFQPDLYPAGSWGPEAFEKLIRADGKNWTEFAT